MLGMGRGGFVKGLLGSSLLSTFPPPPLLFFLQRKKIFVFKEALVLRGEVPTCFPAPKERSVCKNWGVFCGDWRFH